MVLLAVPQKSVLGALLFNIFTNNVYFVDGILTVTMLATAYCLQFKIIDKLPSIL